MSDKKAIYPKGVMLFDKHEKAPDFVVGTLVITPNDLIEWLKENSSLLTEYNQKKQLKLQIKKGNKGLYAEVDTWQPSGKQSISPDVNTDLPF